MLYFGLVEKGFWVICFDNCDVGLFLLLDELGKLSFVKYWFSCWLFICLKLFYLFDDMVCDVKELMDVFVIKKVYLVGVLMGGMIV